MINSSTSFDKYLTLDIKHGSSCDYHRVTMPFNYLQVKPKVPIYVFNRISSLGLDALYKMKKEGIKIIMDIDDLPFLSKDHYLYEVFKSSGMTAHIIANLKLADVVMTTTPLLASRLKGYNKNIFVVPNALPFDETQFTISKDKDFKSPVVWVGGASHYPDLKEIKGCSFIKPPTLCGYDPKPGLTHDEWLKIRDEHPTAIYEKGLQESNYMDLYDGHKVSIAPLLNSDFNACKSNLKVLESGAKGLPIVCSKVEPYYNSIDSKYVLYAETKHDWETHVNNLIRYEAYNEDVGKALSEHVRLQYNLKDINILRKHIIESFN